MLSRMLLLVIIRMVHTKRKGVEVLVLCTRMAAVIAIDSGKAYLQAKETRETC